MRQCHAEVVLETEKIDPLKQQCWAREALEPVSYRAVQ